MKIIFLDVDGVLNNSKWVKRMFDECVHVYAKDMLEDRAIRLLKQIIDATGASVVITSTWRMSKVKCLLSCFLQSKLLASDIL